MASAAESPDEVIGPLADPLGEVDLLDAVEHHGVDLNGVRA